MTVQDIIYDIALAGIPFLAAPDTTMSAEFQNLQMKQKKLQWTNDYGLPVRAACLSCKHAYCPKTDNNRMCTLTGVSSDRTSICQAWEPRDVLRIMPIENPAFHGWQTQSFVCWNILFAGNEKIDFKRLETYRDETKRNPLSE